MVAEEQEYKAGRVVARLADSGSIPKWVAEGIGNAEFEESTTQNRTGYILETYEGDRKADVQIYKPIEDGRHIITLDIPHNIEIGEMEKGVVYRFVFDQYRAPLSTKISEYLKQEHEVDIACIYRFELSSLEPSDSSEAA